MPCQYVDCNEPVYARQYCRAHYVRLRKYGDPAPRNAQLHGLTLEERLWKNVDRTGGPSACWPWIAKSRHRFGYGQLWDRSGEKPRLRAAPRLAWEFMNGPIPDDLHVLHACNNPACCNATILPGKPLHLFLGMQATAKPHFAKLKRVEIEEIRRLAAIGMPRARIAEIFNIHRGHVGRIIRRDVWKHI